MTFFDTKPGVGDCCLAGLVSGSQGPLTSHLMVGPKFSFEMVVSFVLAHDETRRHGNGMWTAVSAAPLHEVDDDRCLI
ncbi:unnamed protein product [Soboliphyme baturini]|uniref:Secreted protein n=1 Tax=Soboliphyme baturini TaxID=241478 RepID=A0A183ITV6_9BILA|nr:unnamed protein product [Soboliphyme baturini]